MDPELYTTKNFFTCKRYPLDYALKVPCVDVIMFLNVNVAFLKIGRKFCSFSFFRLDQDIPFLKQLLSKILSGIFEKKNVISQSSVLLHTIKAVSCFYIKVVLVFGQKTFQNILLLVLVKCLL